MTTNAASESNISPEEEKIIAELEVEIAEFTRQRDLAIATTRELMAAEDPKNGVYHHEEIFRHQQDKLRLDVEIQFRSNKINRIRLGMEGQVAQEPQGGFLF